MSGYGTKPHLLGEQNEVIRRMMGAKPTQTPLPGPSTLSSKPITSRDPLVATGELKEALGGTPKVPRKVAGSI